MPESKIIPFPEQGTAKNLEFPKSTHSFRFPFVFDGTESALGKVEWTVKGLMISGGLSVIYGPPKSGKSFCAQHAAECVAHGIEFFGKSTKEGLVVYLCGEGAVGFRQRMVAWRKINGLSPTRNFVMMPSALDISTDSDAVNALIADLKALSEMMGQPIVMIVIDTLARYFGPNDENGALEMGRFVNSISRIQEALVSDLGTNPHVCVVHHTGKNIGAGMRGCNALLAAADCAIEVTVKDDGVRQARVADTKDSAVPDPFYYVLRSTSVGVDCDGDLTYSCAVEPTTIIIPDADEEEAAAPRRGRGRPKKSAA